MDAGTVAAIVKYALEDVEDLRIDYVSTVRPDWKTGKFDQSSSVSVWTTNGHSFTITVE